LKKEPRFSALSNMTAISGYTSSVLCYFWTFFFINGWFYLYLGIIQKVIAIITLSLLVVLIYATKKDYSEKVL
jgi:hypothetical protein